MQETRIIYDPSEREMEHDIFLMKAAINCQLIITPMDDAVFIVALAANGVNSKQTSTILRGNTSRMVS